MYIFFLLYSTYTIIKFSTHLEQFEGRKHTSEVGVINDEEVSDFPGLNVDG